MFAFRRVARVMVSLYSNRTLRHNLIQKVQKCRGKVC